ncbi:hypothetical protein WKU33_02285 [Oceanobacillus sp. HCA-5259]|uniref:hypothetical protein n=1 Tax=Oceanobacillus sp. HCA-5259 TaxID=3134661 RepID=UPI0030C0F33D
MQKEKTAKYIKFGRVDDSPYTQKVKQKNKYIIEAIKMKKAGPFWFIKQLFKIK